MSDQKFDEVPWTIQQTFLGILLTLVPWMAVAFGLSFVQSGTRSMPRLSPQADLTNAIITFFISVLIEGAFLIAPLYFASRVYNGESHRWRGALRQLGFRRFNWGRALALIVLLFLLVIVVNQFYQYILTAFHINLQTNDQRILEQSRDAPFTTYATLLVGVLIAPLCEETFFRSFTFMGLLREMPIGWALVFSSLVFAVAHGDVGSFAVLFFIGLALAFLRWRTHSIWPGILLHLINNGVGALLIILVMK